MFINLYLKYKVVIMKANMVKSKRRIRFEKVAGNRVTNIIKILDSLEKCSNKSNYEYYNADIRKMDRALKEKLSIVLKSFSNEIDKVRNA